MKKMRIIIGMFMALSITVMMGCVEEFEANITDMPTEGLVVEGDIISDSTVVFQLSKTLPLDISGENEDLFDTFQDVDAEVCVKGSDGTLWQAQWWGRGKYRVEIGTLKPDVAYHLEIQYNGDTYQSEPQRPLKTRGIEKMAFRQPDLNGPVTISLDTEEGEAGGADYYLWFFEEDWEVRAHFQTLYLYEPEFKRIVEYAYPPVAQGWCYNSTDQIILGTTESNTKNQMVEKTIRTIENNDHRLSCLYSIRVQQRNLTRQEYEYYQVRNKMSNEMGGLFTPQPSELPTNITCSDPSRKVIGYVGCNMGVAHYQLYIPEEEVFYLDTYQCMTGEEPAGSNQDKYMAGFQVWDVMYSDVFWTKNRCVDVRQMHADPMGRPKWWPNPYLYYPETPDYVGF